MRRSTVVLAAVAAMFLSVGTMAEDDSANLAVNGTFDDGLKGWRGQKQENGKSVKVDSMLRVKTSKKGGQILILTIDFADKGKYTTNSTGAVMRVSEKIPKGTLLKITFKAKWISGSKYLKVGRTWGGGDDVVELSSKTKSYSLEFTTGYESTDLIFTITDTLKKGQRSVENGVILLDNVKVEVVKK